MKPKQILLVKLLGEPQDIPYEIIESIQESLEDKLKDSYEVLVINENIEVEVLEPSFWRYIKRKLKIKL